MDQNSSSIRPLTAPILIVFIGMAGLLLVWLLPVMVSMSVMICGLIALISLSYWLSKRPWICLVVLLIGVDTPRINFKLFGLRAEPEHIAIGLLLLAMIWILRRQGLRSFRWMLADALLLGYIGMNFLSSVVMSVQPSQTLKWSLQQSLATLPYFFIRILFPEQEKFQRAVRIMVTTAGIAAAYAVFCYASHRLFGTNFGVGLDLYEGIPAAYGTQSEPNILGSFCGASFILALVLYLKERSRTLLFSAVMTAAAMALSMSRAALGATVVAAGLALIVSRRTGLIERTVLRRTAVVMLGLIVALSVLVLPSYVERFRTVDVSDLASDPDTSIRLLTFGAALEGIARHPILGNGTASIQLFFSYEEFGYEDMGIGVWIGNTEMRVLHDTGIIGLLFFLGFLLVLIRRSVHVLRRSLNVELLGLLLSPVVYVLTFQATDGALLSFFWVHLGFLATALSLSDSSGSIIKAPELPADVSGTQA